MLNALGYSVYLSSFDRTQSWLMEHGGQQAPVFLSLHISEEFCEDYCTAARRVCLWLRDAGYRVLADVSRKTMLQFGETDLAALAQQLGLWALRIDYGLEENEICALAQKMPIVLNASTITEASARKIAAAGNEVYAMHNFYPRPDTGLDADFLLETTQMLHRSGISVLGFIPGDLELRGPIGEGLPTLEEHRGVLPSAAFADLKLRFGLDGIFVGDLGVSEAENLRISDFCADGILRIPATLDTAYDSLYNRTFTCRADSPSGIIRFQESREYSCLGDKIAPKNCISRSRGAITIDNESYGRYSGEVQLLRRDYPADGRVNVIGAVAKSAWLLADNVTRRGQFMLVRR